MRSATLLGVAGACLIAALAATAQPVRATTIRQASLALPVPIIGAEPAFEAVIESAIDRFESAGLDLPPLRIHVHASTDRCQGHLGTYGQFGRRDRIDLCTESEFYVLHELAHAWEQNALSNEVRAAFLFYVERPFWHDRNRPWLDSGAELAANVIAWGLMKPPLSQSQAAASADQLDRFALLTGIHSPRIE
jgi:hypothetical protein